MAWRTPRRNPALLALLALLACLVLSLVLMPRATAGAPESLPDKEEPDVSAGLEKLREPIDRSTARRAWSALLEACKKASWERAQHLLNLGDVPVGDRRVMGPVLADQLCAVLRTIKPVNPSSLDDTSLGPLSEDLPRNYVIVGKVPGPSGIEEIWLRRFRDAASSQQLWLLTRQTVSQIPAWYRERVKKEAGHRPFAERVNDGQLPAGFSAENPRAATQAFVTLTGEGRFADAASLLDLSQVPAAEEKSRGPLLARRLAIVLGQIHPGGYGRMSNDAEGAPERDVPFDEEAVAQARIDDHSLAVRLARYPRRAGGSVWLFSAATVGDIDALYERFGYGWPGDHLPPVFLKWKLLGVQLWQWLGLALAFVGAILLGYLGSYLLRRILLRLTAMTRWTWDDAVANRLRGPLWIALGVAVFAALLPFLSLVKARNDLMLGISRLLAILAVGWALIRLIDALGDHLLKYFQDRRDEMGMAMVPVARKILKPIVFFIIAIVALQNIGMNVGGLLAGLGIGGLAIALAGKNTLENLFGSIVISLDRPFRLGDTVKVGDIQGTVEDLGLRSTRVRTMDRTLVTIPNSQMADAKVENFSRRDRMRLFTTLGVQYDTSADQIHYIVDELKRYLRSHPKVWQESFSVRFVGFGDCSLNIELTCWIATADWNEFTAIREAVLIDFGHVVDKAGAIFAYPSRTVYTGKATDADPKRARQAAEAVAARRAAGELPTPHKL